MFFWIASYPKSGNTWLRSLITDYLYGDHESFYTFDNLNNILLFPTRDQLSNLVNKSFGKNILSNDFLSSQWINLQKAYLKEDLVIYKTHNAYHKNGTFFTDPSITKGAIYLLRDPRDIICSYSDWYKTNYDEYINKLTNPTILKNYCQDGEFPFTYVGSWLENVSSWELAKHHFPVLFIKYEELYENPKIIFKKVLLFLKKFINIEIDDGKIKNCLDRSALEKLKKIENNQGFDENSGKNNFFNKGGSRFKFYLTKDSEKKIKDNFFNIMQKYNYF